jgi:uncharacterized SAM-dependent methyltransferase
MVKQLSYPDLIYTTPVYTPSIDELVKSVNVSYKPTTDPIITDYINFFSGSASVDMMKYAYLSDNDYYDQLARKCTDYYLCKEETNIIHNHLDKFALYLGGNVNIFEIGPGSETPFVNKMLPILLTLQCPQSYYAIDFCGDFAEQAINCTKKYFPFLRTGTIVKNVVNLTQKDFAVENSPKAFFMLGSTLGNFNSKFVNLFFKSISEALSENDKFIFSVDTNQDPVSLEKAYFNEYTSKLSTNILQYAASNFTNVDYEKGFKHIFHWDEGTTTVKLMFKAEFDQFIKILNQEILIKKDSLLYVGQAKKFHSSEIQRILIENKLHLIDKLNSSNRMVTYICQKK